MKQTRFLSLPVLLLAIAIFILLNLIGGFGLSSARLDLTEGHLNTLSDGTRQILAELEQPVELQFYLSQKTIKQVPGLQNLARRVENLLQEYAILGGNKLILEQIDPEPFSEAEDNAVAAGLQGVPLQGGGEALYFGLAAHAGEEKRVIPFFQPERESFLEYDLSELIHALSHPQKQTVGILSALPIEGGYDPRLGATEPWMFVEQLRKQFDVRLLKDGEQSIPAEVNTLLVVDPRGLAVESLYAIDQFVLRGGRAMVFADPLSELLSRGNPGALFAENTEYDQLLNAWGIELEKNKVVGDLQFAQQVSYPGRGGRTQTLQYLPWLMLDQTAYNSDEVMTSQLGKINLASAGALKQSAGATTELVPLLQSSDQAMLIELQEVAFSPNPARLLGRFQAAEESFTLAARLTGSVTTAFPEGLPKKEAEEENGTAADKEPQDTPPLAEHLVTSQEPVNLIIIADSDLLQDRFWVQVNNFFGQRLAVPIAANLDLVSNGLESLAGSSALMSIRSRGSFQRPFTLVSEIQQRAELRYRAKEQALLQTLQDAETKLSKLQAQRQDAGSTQLTEEQQKEVDKFIAEKVKTRKQLREVQYQLRADIEDLEAMLKAFNIAFVPGLIGVVAFLGWVFRRARGREM